MLAIDRGEAIQAALLPCIALINHAIERAQRGLIVLPAAGRRPRTALRPGSVELVPVGLQLHVIVGPVQKPDEPVYLVSSLLAEPADRAENIQSRPAVGLIADVSWD
jgi:hypothetical protein